ncbi:hypothetical protein KR49_09250 [Synechococcus sp. KORDI-49]|nr:hypothetical protein KR49_09250 [Synechococcus sp. KORDI-49]
MTGNRSTGGGQHQIDALETGGIDFLHGEGAAVPGLGLTGGAG